MPKFLVKPTLTDAGLNRVRNPDAGGSDLTVDGASVEWSIYWQRRLDDGEITREEVPDPIAPVAPPAAKATAKTSQKAD